MSTLYVDNIYSKTGTSQALDIDSSGRVLLSAIPFMKMEVGSNTSLTGSSSGVTTPFASVISSRGITLNTSTYMFQVPVTGLYHFSGSVRVDATVQYVWWTVADSSGTRLQASGFALGNYYSNPNAFSTVSGSMLHPLTASTDYQIQFGSNIVGSIQVNGGQTWMDIFLLGAS